MLSAPRSVYLAAILSALLALIAGITVAVALHEGSSLPGRSAVTLIQGGAECEDNASDPRCYVFDEDEEDEGGSGEGGSEDGDSGGGACIFGGGGNGDGDESQTVSDDRAGRAGSVVLVAQGGGVEIPCVHPELGFYADGCYWAEAPAIAAQGRPAPPDGKTEGEDGRTLWASCIGGVSGEMPNQQITLNAVERWRWFDFDEVPTVTPDQVALDWLADVDLSGVTLQLAPPETGAGLVGMPVWLGIDQTPESLGPLTDEHCIDGVCVTIVAHVSEVEWDMGDGTALTCTPEQHVVWQPGMDFRSPGDNCHHFYERSSRDLPDRKYQISATSQWEVHWEADASAAEGDLSADATSSGALQIDEIQVLTR